MNSNLSGDVDAGEEGSEVRCALLVESMPF